MQTGSKIKKARAPRGRPREYNEAEVLEAVLGVFWQKGFSAASLPELSAAAGITRPSLYTALGDKLSMYLRSLEHFKAGLKAQIAASLAPERPLAEGLLEFYTAGIDLYLSGGKHPRGCLVICTAAAEATEQPEVRLALREVVRLLDDAFAERFAAEAQICPSAENIGAKQAAEIASAVLHSLAIRAKAGQSRANLLALAAAATSMLAPSKKTPFVIRAKAVSGRTP